MSAGQIFLPADPHGRPDECLVCDTLRAKQILTPAQAAHLLGLGKTTVVDWCNRQILPAIRVDSRWYLRRPELLRWLDGQESEKEVSGQENNRNGHDIARVPARAMSTNPPPMT